MFGWLAFVVAAIAIGNAVGTKNISMQDANVGQSRKAGQILSKGFPRIRRLSLCARAELDAHRQRSRVPSDDQRRRRRRQGKPAIKTLKSPLGPKNRDQVSNNRRTVIVTRNMKGKADVAKKKIDGVEASVAKVGDRHPGFYVGETAGSAPARHSTRCSQTS